MGHIDEVQRAIAPVYPYRSVGAAIELYCGPLKPAGHEVRQGQVSVDMAGRFAVRWTGTEPFSSIPLGQSQISFHHPDYGPVNVSALTVNSAGEGELSDVELGTGPLSSLIVHFLNLPWILPAGVIHDERNTWAGRWCASGGGWDLTLDTRPDHTSVWSDLRRSSQSVITHTGRLTRSDDREFSSSEAVDALAGWQIALSFAFGRWVTPAAPVGFDRDGTRVWEQWAAWRHSTVSGYQSWCDPKNGDDLRAFCELFLEAWGRDDERDVVRYMAHHLIASNEAATTVEARIMLIQAAMEYLSWVTYVLSNQRSAAAHDRGRGKAARHVTELLDAAGIPRTVPNDLAAIRKLRATQGHRDGVESLIWVRNKLTHPKDAGEPYRIESLVSEAWRLSAEWAELMLLHRLGYHGQYHPRSIDGGFETDRHPVPWLLHPPG